MRERLAEMKEKELEWIERMDATATTAAAADTGDSDKEKEASGMDPEDDFKREMVL